MYTIHLAVVYNIANKITIYAVLFKLWHSKLLKIGIYIFFILTS